ncbi:MAG: helix-turn-helix domain-containing protein [Desulfobacteraceae bacterium]|jgi:hypothetical protein
MINFEAIVDRIKDSSGASTEKEVAELFGISAPDFSRSKKKGTLLPLIVGWAMERDISLDWLIAGKDTQTSPMLADSVNLKGSATFGKKLTLNNDLLTTIISAIEKELDSRELTLEAEKKAEAISLLYELYSDSQNL